MATSNVKDYDWSEKEDAGRDRALIRVKAVLSTNLSQSVLGRTIISEIAAFQNEDRIRQVVLDTFSKKSTSTLLKRAGRSDATVPCLVQV